MFATNQLTCALVIHAEAKISVLVYSMVAIRPAAQFVVGYRVKEGWYVFRAHGDGLSQLGGMANFSKRLAAEGTTD